MTKQDRISVVVTITILVVAVLVLIGIVLANSYRDEPTHIYTRWQQNLLHIQGEYSGQRIAGIRIALDGHTEHSWIKVLLEGHTPVHAFDHGGGWPSIVETRWEHIPNNCLKCQNRGRDQYTEAEHDFH